MHTLTPGRLLDIAASALGPDALDGVQLHAAARLLARAAWPADMPRPGQHEVRSWRETQGGDDYPPPVEPFPLLPTAPALIWWREPADLPALAALLARRYPHHHALGLLALDEAGALLASDEIRLDALPSRPPPPASCLLLHIPALPIADDRRGVDGLRWVLARLLGPGGCPWDVRQTHQSLRAALLEEAYEVLEALDAGDMPGLSEELGDLLITVVAHSEMARQGGAFSLEDVLAQVTAKLIRRHPHVFGDLAVSGEAEVLGNWEQIKARELAEKGRARPGALDGVPARLPALAAAQKLTKKATRAGFTWGEIGQVWAKLHEELAELREAASGPSPDHVREELGDALFVVADLARWLDLDAETALREANLKFRRRFAHVEAAAAAAGRALQDHSLDELLALWSGAKAAEGAPAPGAP